MGPFQDHHYNEALILRAASHIEASRVQRALCNKKVEAEAVSNLKRFLESPDQGVTTLIMDYRMNLKLPNLGSEQCGDAYYYSPIWLYCLGIVDAGRNRMTAYLYSEAEGKRR